MGVNRGHPEKILAIIILIFSTLNGFANTTTEAFCFSSGDNKKIQFEMRIIRNGSPKWTGGFIKYAKSLKTITIARNESFAISFSKDQPDQSTTLWLEIVDGKISGTYELVTQGASVLSMQYINKKNKKLTSFFLDPNTEYSDADGCKW